MKRIHIDAEKCSGCRFCEMICSFRHEGKFGTGLSRITVIKEDKHGFDYPIVCHQCDSCASITACPTSALTRTVLGTIRVNQDACTGCGSCIGACPFEALKLDHSSRPLVCDLCEGEPACVKRCPTDALTFTESDSDDDRSEDVSKKLLRRWGIID